MPIIMTTHINIVTANSVVVHDRNPDIIITSKEAASMPCIAMPSLFMLRASQRI